MLAIAIVVGAWALSGLALGPTADESVWLREGRTLLPLLLDRWTSSTASDGLLRLVPLAASGAGLMALFSAIRQAGATAGAAVFGLTFAGCFPYCFRELGGLSAVPWAVLAAGGTLLLIATARSWRWLLPATVCALVLDLTLVPIGLGAWLAASTAARRGEQRWRWLLALLAPTLVLLLLVTKPAIFGERRSGFIAAAALFIVSSAALAPRLSRLDECGRRVLSAALGIELFCMGSLLLPHFHAAPGALLAAAAAAAGAAIGLVGVASAQVDPQLRIKRLLPVATSPLLAMAATALSMSRAPLHELPVAGAIDALRRAGFNGSTVIAGNGLSRGVIQHNARRLAWNATVVVDSPAAARLIFLGDQSTAPSLLEHSLPTGSSTGVVTTPGGSVLWSIPPREASER